MSLQAGVLRPSRLGGASAKPAPAPGQGRGFKAQVFPQPAASCAETDTLLLLSIPVTGGLISLCALTAFFRDSEVHGDVEAGEVVEFSSFHAVRLDSTLPPAAIPAAFPLLCSHLGLFSPFWKPRGQDFIVENVDPDRSALEGGKCCARARKG